ncbi:MAG: nucleoside deaminase [Bacteroidota bacterium]
MLSLIYDDAYFMRQALQEAALAAAENEVPVGAVVTCQHRIIARGHNQTERLRDVTAHAEMIALTAATEYLGSKYLPDCTLYVTLEPCMMCAGALAWAQIGRIVYGASDDRRGFMRFGKQVLHPRTKLDYGIEADACQMVLQDFFKKRR